MKLLGSLGHFFGQIYPAARRWAYRFHGGVFPKYNKSLSALQPIRPQLMPTRLLLPLLQPVGLPAEPLVRPGQKVKKNQLLACASKDPDQALVVPIHAPTSGTIVAIEPATLPHPSGLEGLCIVLEPDGRNEQIENVLEVNGNAPQTPQELKRVLVNAGIVGMGGAGFPTYAKIPQRRGVVHTLLINGAECEPFITCDDLLMQTQANAIVQGALICAHALGAERILCGIESNKPKAIQAMTEAARNTAVDIKVVETVYPMGGQKQLTYELTGIETPYDAHAIDVGLLMMNVATFAAIYRAVHKGEPLTSRLVTVSGHGLSQPYNMEVMIGTPFEELAQAAQPKVALNYPLVMGGPMMGFAVKSNAVPVLKTTNCVLANPPEPVELQMPCIRCGACMDACPVNLLPQQMYWYAQAHQYDKVEKLNVFDCIECGCCSYVCPSYIPLVQYYRHAKSEIKELHANAKAAELAKQRHEFRQARIEREKQEREARLKAKKEAVKKEAGALETAPSKDSEHHTGQPPTAAQKARAAAAARVQAAKQTSQTAQSQNSVQSQDPNIDPTAQPQTTQPSQPAMPAARQKAIEAAKAAAVARARSTESNASHSPQKTASTPSSTKDKEGVRDETPQDNAKMAAKQAAMRAAQKRVQANKDAAENASEKNTSRTQAGASNGQTTDSDQPPSPDDKRARAVEAARQRAAQRKAQQQTDPNPDDAASNDTQESAQ